MIKRIENDRFLFYTLRPVMCEIRFSGLPGGGGGLIFKKYKKLGVFYKNLQSSAILAAMSARQGINPLPPRHIPASDLYAY